MGFRGSRIRNVGASFLIHTSKGNLTDGGVWLRQPRAAYYDTSNPATLVVDVDQWDVYVLNDQTNSLEIDWDGSPGLDQQLIIRITDDGSPVALTWSASFGPTQQALPYETPGTGIPYSIGFVMFEDGLFHCLVAV